MASLQPVMVLLAGPNGAGKSTLYHQFLQPDFERLGVDVPFLNADDYAREQWGHDASPDAAYQAAQAIARQRDACFADRRSFATETVFSHPSKIELLDQARQHGFVTYLEIVMVPLEASIERVAARVADGGHDVPEDKIRSRYGRTDALLAQAIPGVDQARIWENAGQDTIGAPGARFNHELVAKFEHGRLVSRRRTPDWFPPQLTERIRQSIPDRSSGPQVRAQRPGFPPPAPVFPRDKSQLRRPGQPSDGRPPPRPEQGIER